MAERTNAFAAELVGAVGEEVAGEILEGIEGTASASQAKKAGWWKRAMERFDRLVEEPTRVRVMERCGYRCAWKGAAERIGKARRKSRTMDEFWVNLRAGYFHQVPLERDGNTVFASYTQCYCGQVKATKEPISSTYCHCSKGYFMAAFETGLGRPVRVELLQSIVSGAATCRFAIYIPEDEFEPA